MPDKKMIILITPLLFIPLMLAGMGGATDTSLIATLDEPSSSVISTDVSPDGGLIAVGTSGGRIKVYEKNNYDSPLHSLDHSDGWVWGITFSPNGQYLAGGGSSANLDVFNMSDGAKLDTLGGLDDNVGELDWDRDYIASNTNEANVYIVNASDPTSISTSRQITNPSYSATLSITFSDDGSELYRSDGSNGIMIFNTSDPNPSNWSEISESPLYNTSMDSMRGMDASSNYIIGGGRKFRGILHI